MILAQQQKSYSIRGCKLVLRLRVEVAGVVALVQLARWLAGKAVDHAPAPDGRPFKEHIGPALDVLVLVDREELGRPILAELRQPAVPGEDGDVGDRVVGTRGILALRQTAIEHVEQ